MYQNQNLSKIWSFGTRFPFQGVILNAKKFFDVGYAWSDILFNSFFSFFSKCEWIRRYLQVPLS